MSRPLSSAGARYLGVTFAMGFPFLMVTGCRL
jgi:hypothetical protein